MNKYQEALNSIKEKTTEIDEYETIPKSTFCHCVEEDIEWYEERHHTKKKEERTND